MKDLRCSSTHSDKSSRRGGEKAIHSNRNVDATIIENNPKIDTQLLSDHHRLTEASKGVPKRKRGANYRLSHPFRSNDVPTDAIPIGRRRDIIKKRKRR